MPKRFRVFVSFIGVFMLLSLILWIIGGKVWFLSPGFIINRLEQLLPWIEKHQLVVYRNQGWCKTLVYQKGVFSETEHPSTCNLFDGEPSPFSPEARADFQELRQKLRLSVTRVAFINGYYEANSLHSIEFRLNCLFCSRTGYIYEPNYTLPNNSDLEIWYNPINKDWYQVNEDWN